MEWSGLLKLFIGWGCSYISKYVHTRLGLANLMSEELEIGMIETIHQIMMWTISDFL